MKPEQFTEVDLTTKLFEHIREETQVERPSAHLAGTDLKKQIYFAQLAVQDMRQHDCLKSSDRIVLGVLLELVLWKGTLDIYASLRFVSERSGFSVTSVARSLKRLAEHGYVTRLKKGKGFTASQYRVNIEMFIEEAEMNDNDAWLSAKEAQNIKRHPAFGRGGGLLESAGDIYVELRRNPDGLTVAEIVDATGWSAATVYRKLEHMLGKNNRDDKGEYALVYRSGKRWFAAHVNLNDVARVRGMGDRDKELHERYEADRKLHEKRLAYTKERQKRFARVMQRRVYDHLVANGAATATELAELYDVGIVFMNNLLCRMERGLLNEATGEFVRAVIKSRGVWYALEVDEQNQYELWGPRPQPAARSPQLARKRASLGECR